MNALIRKGDWMQTRSGRQFWPLDPRPEDVHIGDIAAALSKLCRYGGQCLRFYSVAEHCVHVAHAAPEGLGLAALMHDGSEAFLSDVIRPIKPFLSNYLEIERGLERVIAERFGLAWPHPPEVKRLDTAILADERDQVMAPPPVPWSQTTEPALGVTLRFWTPEQAESAFLCAFYDFGGIHFADPGSNNAGKAIRRGETRNQESAARNVAPDPGAQRRPAFGNRIEGLVMTDIATLQADVDRLKSELSDAQARVTRAKIDACGVSIGDIVVSRGKRFRVCEIDVSWQDKPWLKGNSRLKDGSWGLAARNLYDNWTKELQR